jgi:alpha-beta hydrolase superfamily lysophospholipase
MVHSCMTEAPPSTLRSDDGLDLAWQSWPAQGELRGQLLLVHGLGEHVLRYSRLAAALNAEGWQVHGWDHRGHGRSQGRRGDMPQPDSLLRDTAAAIDRARGAGSGPLVLLGHSLGGALAARFVAEGLADRPAPWWRDVDALVLSSPALDAGMNVLQKLLLAVARPLFPHLLVGNGLKPEWISRDPAVVRAYLDDPLVHDRVSARVASFIVDAGETVRQRAAQWRLPTLLMWGGSDRCVDPRGSAAFAAAAPPALVAAQVWPALAHEIFNEPERQQVVAELLRWVGARVGARVVRET